MTAATHFEKLFECKVKSILSLLFEVDLKFVLSIFVESKDSFDCLSEIPIRKGFLSRNKSKFHFLRK